MDAGEGHRVNGTASVSAGANATYVSGGYYYTVVQNLAQLQAINKNLDGLYVLGGNILGGSYYCTALQSIGGPPASSAAPWTVSATASAISRSATPGRMSGCSPAPRAP